MAFKALVTVGGYDFPEPSSYKVNTATLVDSARNVQGKMIGSVIRDDVTKIELSWKYLTVEQWSAILRCFDIKRGGKFINQVTYYEPLDGDWNTKEMYVNDRPSPMWRRNPNTGDIMGWVDCQLNLIEV
jgi:hypothetical protein